MNEGNEYSITTYIACSQSRITGCGQSEMITSLSSRQPWFSQFSHFAFSFHFEASSIYIRETFSFRSNDLFVGWAAASLNLQF